MLTYNELSDAVEKLLKTPPTPQTKLYNVLMFCNSGITGITNLEMNFILTFKPNSVEDVYNYIIQQINKQSNSTDKYYYRLPITGYITLSNTGNYRSSVYTIAGAYNYPGSSRSGLTVWAIPRDKIENNAITQAAQAVTITDNDFKDASKWQKFLVTEM